MRVATDEHLGDLRLLQQHADHAVPLPAQWGWLLQFWLVFVRGRDDVQAPVFIGFLCRSGSFQLSVEVLQVHRDQISSSSATGRSLSS